ncbi:hypothetical protein ACFSJY_05695 [Thalassotalea euphylliae]|uniref:hypothetical protein n=1 Tax=Thalassotalea euphylliae TaxID=1655234 RepID=UPI0036318931
MKRIMLFSALALISNVTVAGDLTVELAQCKAEQDSLKRLVCYDSLAEKALKTPVAVNKDVNKPGPQANKTETVASMAPKAVAVVKPNPPSVAAPVAVAQTDQAEAQFGQENKKKPEQVDEVSFVVKTASLSLRKKWRFTFENGQQWEQKDTEKFAKFKAGDQVTIKRGALNAFYLKKADSNRTIRVKRIK